MTKKNITDGVAVGNNNIPITDTPNQHQESTIKNRSLNDDLIYKYKSGIPTLRSSSHRVRHSSKKKTQKNEPQPKRTTQRNDTIPIEDNSNASVSAKELSSNADGNVGTMLPASIREVELIPYDMKKYDFMKAIIDFLNSLDSNIVGTFRQHQEQQEEQQTQHEANNDGLVERPKLEYFEVPIASLTKKSKRGILLAQDHLSTAMHDCFFGDDRERNNNQQQKQQQLENSRNINTDIVSTFDNFVTGCIIPHLKQRFINEQIVKDESTKIRFYYQRPPTLRIQPGPARARVNKHKDKDYGHQNGELNFWIPLTNRMDTGVDLHVETEEDRGDYTPLGTDVGFVSSFFGSGCSHYVNENRSEYTRISLDFRIGIEPFYDPNWSKIGTRDDHLRRCVEL